MKKNLVLGYAQNYGIQELLYFVRSFREFNPNDDMCLCISKDKIDELEPFLTHNNVKINVINNVTFNIFNDNKFLFFYEFLKNNPNYDKICITDTRDVIFQNDPFLNCTEKEFCYVWIEDTGITIGQNIWNSDWIQNLYPDHYIRYSKKNVICSGVLIGSYGKIIRVIKDTIDEMKRLYKTNYEYAHLNIIEQAAFMYLVYSVYNSDEVIIKNPDNLCVHLGSTLSNSLANDSIFFKNGKIYIDDKIISIVHQYDRHGFLRAFYKYYFLHKKLSDEKDIDPQTLIWS